MQKKLFIQALVDKESWIMPYAKKLIEILNSRGHSVSLIRSKKQIKKGNILVILSWGEILEKKILDFHEHNLIVHESALPRGKGWSPLTWQILEGKNKIPITLFEAAEKVDSGDIYFQNEMIFRGDELIDELRKQQGEKTIELIIKFINNYPDVVGREQKGKETFYKKRSPEDSELNINKSIKKQFNLLRLVDNERYPAFFIHLGKKYIIKIKKKEIN